MIRRSLLVGLLLATLVGLVLGLAPISWGQSTPDPIFSGPGFMLDTRQWTPFYVEDGVYFCIVENGKFTCATIAPGSVLLLRNAQPDSTEGY